MIKANDTEQIFEMTEKDLTVIKKNPEYLIFKFKELADRDKEDILDYINLKIVQNRKIKNKENIEMGKVISIDFTKMTV